VWFPVARAGSSADLQKRSVCDMLKPKRGAEDVVTPGKPQRSAKWEQRFGPAAYSATLDGTNTSKRAVSAGVIPEETGGTSGLSGGSEFADLP